MRVDDFERLPSPFAFVIALLAAPACSKAGPSASTTPGVVIDSASPGAPSAGPLQRASGGLVLETRRLRESKPALREAPGVEAKSCSLDAEYPVVKHPDRDLAKRIDAALYPREAKLEPECDFATRYEVRYRVVLNERGFLSVVFDANWCCGAHPSYAKRFVNLRSADAEVLTLQNLFQPGAVKKLAQRLKPELRRALPADGTDWDAWIAENAGDLRDFSLEPGGLRFSSFNLAPHALQSALEAGFRLECSELAELGLAPGALDGLCSTR
jgi:hypothetical protein